MNKHIEDRTDAEIIKAMEDYRNSPIIFTKKGIISIGDIIDLIKRQQAEIERLQKIIVGFMDEVGTWSNKYDVDISNIHKLPILAKEDYNIKNKIKSEAIKEFAEKIDQLFYRYAHILSHADCARKDYIKADDGTEIEMQSVWDVFALKKYGIAEYEEMNRLQTNIELIEKGRLLAELKKDFRVLVKEMTEVSENVC